MADIYRVVKIIDKENIIINAGKSNFIKKGDKFEIFTKGEEVIDISTSKSLGSLDTIKEVVTVVTVLPKMCICQKRIRVSLTNLANFTKEQFSYKEEAVTLNINVKEITGGFSKDLVIRVGDLARLAD